ncbi:MULTISPECIES: cupredoxin domain-containing protein [unclassified Bradyrhizobium]|uniref:cupredoxin domain-containing protein n=2 Tax=unclassified Bradyrhizobium TaxID=2631580 RepID=UPI002916E66E|nr:MULTISPECIES: cupredoxin domain-containing protein [unclassified Bradyrhizobium]
MLVDVVRKLVVVGGSVGMLLMAAQAHAGESNEICLTYANGQFEPKEPTVPADAPLTIRVKNMESKAIEFESETLKVEKVIAANSEAVLNVRAMKSGRYEFYNDFNEKARGFVNVQ